LEIGGFDEKSITEDFATSIKFHLRGYQSLYYNKVAAFGMAPENLVAYFKQQIRWSAGTIGVFRSIIFNFLRNPFKLKPIQWLEYFLSGIYYFIGWAFFIMIMGPVLYLIFDFPKMYSNHQVYLFPFITYLILNLYVFYFSMTKRNYKFFEIYHGVMLSFLIFPILLKSTVLGLFGKKMTFVVTTKGKNEQMPLVFLWPYIIMILLNIVAFIFGISKVKSNPIGISGNLFWVIWHIFILSNIFYFNKKQINDT
jgi:cellulose synthase (UDP-forming)